MLEARGDIRGGRFVSGMSGEQYALPDAVDRLRELRRSGPDERLVAIGGADPLNLTGIVTLGDRIRAAASSRIVYRNGVPIMAMEGDMLRTLADADATVLADAAAIAAGRRVPVSHGYVGQDLALNVLRARLMAEAVRVAQQIPRRWRRGISLDPRYQEPKGQATLWTRARKVLWSWWPWFVVAVATAYDNRWGWAFSTGAMAFVSYLVTPIETPPQYGLEHEFSVDSDEFLTTITGATGVPILAGNRIDVLHNGDEFYPVMLEEIGRAQASITIEAYIYWAGEIGRRFADALAAKAREGIPVKILLDAVGSATIGSDILETLEKGGCQLAWYNRIHWYTIGQFNHRTHRKSLDHRRPRRVHRRRRHCRCVARSRTVAGALARYAGAHRRSGGDAAADRLRAELVADHGRAAVRCDLLSGTHV